MYAFHNKHVDWYILKRRDATKVLHDVLTLANRELPKTRIVYQANLNFGFAQRFFDFLLSGGYMVQSYNSALKISNYKLTQKGEHLLRLLQQLESEISPLFLRKHETSKGDTTASPQGPGPKTKKARSFL